MRDILSSSEKEKQTRTLSSPQLQRSLYLFINSGDGFHMENYANWKMESFPFHVKKLAWKNVVYLDIVLKYSKTMYVCTRA